MVVGIVSVSPEGSSDGSLIPEWLTTIEVMECSEMVPTAELMNGLMLASRDRVSREQAVVYNSFASCLQCDLSLSCAPSMMPSAIR